MTPKDITNFRIDTELLDALRTLATRDGVPMSESVRRAIRAYVIEKGVTLKSGHKRADTRRRP